MLFRVEVAPKPYLQDIPGRRAAHRITHELGVPVDDAAVVKTYTVAGLDRDQVRRAVDIAALHDPVSHLASLDPLASDFDWIVEVGLRPGVTDNEGRTARETLALALGLTREQAKNVAVYTSAQYALRGSLTPAQVEHIAKDHLCNELIQRFEIKSAAQWAEKPGFEPKAAQVTGRSSDEVLTVPLSAMNDEALMAFSRENVLALSLEEMHAIRDHFLRQDVQARRAAQGLPKDPTDAELEVLAQTWSEHCKHKIFAADIDYRNAETGRSQAISSLYKTYVQGSTQAIRKAMGQDDICLSVFKDNAGVIRFSEDHHLCVKVETHNSPSALDPYGGALTGIVGVNRDPMGTGMGANLLCNTDVFCFASPFHDEPLPPRLLHPRRVMEGVREGVEHGGNKSGIPTVNGSVVFHERFLGKPLVFCGTVGLMPAQVNGKPSQDKRALPGDLIVMTGGRIGKDGIHGATFSSEELHEGSPATAVQIGDPITQRKMYDFLMRARDTGLYHAITDNGAGGLSSSVGEMANDSGGALLDLARAPLKYDGLRPWEILLSEAQERMTLAVPPERIDDFLALAAEMDVEATVLGSFNDSGCFKAVYGEKPVALLDMDFLHDGTPRMRLEAVWERPATEDSPLPAEVDHAGLLKRMLGRLNICSKEYMIRQYDHEVKGGSVVKPLVGVERDGPADAAVMRPVLSRREALVLSHGICPRYSDLDAYWMMAGAIDEAVRNAVAAGGDLAHMAGVDNFCWCDPVQSEKTPDGRYKLAQLVRANQALAHYCQAYGVPCVSGKDSMKNDYTGGGAKISIPPTVLFTALSVIDDASQAVTSDFKQAGDVVYVLGLTRPELGASELGEELGLTFADVPQVDAVSAKRRYQALRRSAKGRQHNACHDCSDGGLAVALAEMCLGGRLGADVDLSRVPASPDCSDPLAVLYSESHSRFVVGVPSANVASFEKLFAGQWMAPVGRVTTDGKLTVRRGEAVLLSETVDALAEAFKATLDW
ncbi:Phosphoribosylformylglycinamidine synthase subunit PurL [Fundidesulfovibrio magnetotacticus]|uniref:Phosphoribosylformylglycinamidine synthase subunit PurL n=1 Tax=Fundidesulfovibrio magnetotacticus TaxID=2730080 RepID=A0A6V8LI32_9BACT|nr:AIR synthase-related protein [Fundidesulfovibrio magnetotacticus]GFK92392.1 Phosphoribosylformylglycinamidine synthase subunit PurL [Fundidesulfovibrio magnetotacticus]